jgi:hypothetical protein
MMHKRHSLDESLTKLAPKQRREKKEKHIFDPFLVERAQESRIQQSENPFIKIHSSPLIAHSFPGPYISVCLACSSKINKLHHFWFFIK